MKLWLKRSFDKLRTGKQNLPTLVNRQAQKGTYPGYVVKRNVATIRMDTGVKQRPTVTTHQFVERSNPLTALGLDRAGNQPDAPVGRMPQEAKALGNARDTLTWGGYSG